MPEGLRAGCRTFWRQLGHGPDPALLIHCSLAQSGAWAGVAERLADVLSMTAFDLPGHGRSADWTGVPGFFETATAVARTFLDGPRHLVGHSFGGVVALGLALERPDLVRSLTLIEPVLFAAARDTADGVYDAYLERIAPFGNAVDAGDLDRASRLFSDLWGDGSAWDKVPDRQRKAMAERIHLIPATEATLLRDAAGLLRPGGLEALDLPCLLVEGDRSPEIVAAILDVFEERLPRAVRRRVAGAGHMVPITHPDPVAAAIRELL